MNLPILIDCDEVLSDFVGRVLELAAEFGGIYANREQITGWDMSKVLGWPGLDACVTERINKRELCFRLEETPGAISWLRQVEAEFGVDRVFICTSPWNAEWASQRMAWLERRGVPKSRQIQCSAKHLIPGYLIDDAAHHAARRPPGQAFIIDAPWNRGECPGTPRGNHEAALAWLREVAR